jgi:hypothetical protein
MNACCTVPVEKIAANEHLTGGECCLITDQTEAPSKADCPVSQASSKKVQTRTVRSLVRGDSRWRLENVQYYYCEDPTCPVVYFPSNGGAYFTISDLDVKVFSKDKGDDVNVCYCFDWTRGRIKKEISETGTSIAPKEIARQVKEGLCSCDVKNPKGRCCLGDVNSVVKEALQGVAYK